MIDITRKSNTYREALARSLVRVSKEETVERLRHGKVPKGDVFEMSRAGGLLAVKKTADLIPDCHPMPIEHASVTFRIEGLDIIIEMKVATVYKTGVEVEAMHGASVVALIIYDMLKPIDKKIEIMHIGLVYKKGGKSEFLDDFKRKISAAVVVCSDTVSGGQKPDKAGKTICEKLGEYDVEVEEYEIIPDDADRIAERLQFLTGQNRDLVIFTGGTGLSSRDVSPETIRPLLDKEIPGIAEVMRSYGQDRMPYAMLSRGIAGMKGKSIVLTLPGSAGGASESMDALFPHILHAFKIIAGRGH